MTNEQLLIEGARRIGLGDLKTDLFLSYVDMLKTWGRRINLTSILEDREIIIKHLIDSLTAVEFIPPHSKVLDIGTGAGLPGIPVYMYDSSIDVTLLESVGKKVAFLKDVKRTLGLSGIDIHHGRAEKVPKGMKRRFDRVTSRAIGSMDVVVTLGNPYLDIGGRMVIMKGPRGKEEWKDYSKKRPEDMELVLTRELKLPFLNERRVIVIAKPAFRQKEAEN